MDIARRQVIIHTDSQNIIGLQNRRERLERKNYRSNQNKLLNNHKLYQEFYKLTDTFDCTFVKVKGHKQSSQKDDIDILFTLVDRAARDTLREMENILIPGTRHSITVKKNAKNKNYSY